MRSSASLDSPVADYQVKQSNGQFKLVGAAYANAPYGLALPKNGSARRRCSPRSRCSMQNGTYSSILSQWGLTRGAIPASQVKINGAIS